MSTREISERERNKPDQESAYPDVALLVPRILLPGREIDLHRWSVVACDQYTSEPEYWEDVSRYVGNGPSTFHLVFPECYLQNAGLEQRIGRIHTWMRRYLEEDVLVEQEPAMYLTVRQLPGKMPRTGLLAAIDLEQYDFRPGTKTLIRPTEETILDRIPPRKKIRTNAALELPHVMVLIDDKDEKVIEPAADSVKDASPIYDVELMKGGGRVTSYRIRRARAAQRIISALRQLADPNRFESKYHTRDVVLYAVGDGNHSLATAKEVWEETKKSAAGDMLLHPARWALVEIVNIYDTGLLIEPIHRALFNVGQTAFFDFAEKNSSVKFENVASIDIVKEFLNRDDGPHRIGVISPDGNRLLTIADANAAFPVAALQIILDDFLKENSDSRIDYIHGFDSLVRIGRKDGNIGFVLPPVHKENIFPYLLNRGTFPQKSFSLGEAWEKRFYIEARKIR